VEKLSVLTAMCLYAAAQSTFAMMQPLPALSKTDIHLAVDDIDVGNSSATMPSLTLNPRGADRFRIIRAVPFGFILHMTPLIFAFFGRSEGLNGPATIPCCTQEATASVTSAPKSCELAAFVLTEGSLPTPLQPMSAPFSKSLQTASSLRWSSQPTALAQDIKRVAETGDTPFMLAFEGKDDQKSSLAGIL
jgi:hypothetical protein